jgi:hypothetical protein
VSIVLAHALGAPSDRQTASLFWHGLRRTLRRSNLIRWPCDQAERKAEGHKRASGSQPSDSARETAVSVEALDEGASLRCP